MFELCSYLVGYIVRSLFRYVVISLVRYSVMYVFVIRCLARSLFVVFALS